MESVSDLDLFGDLDTLVLNVDESFEELERSLLIMCSEDTELETVTENHLNSDGLDNKKWSDLYNCSKVKWSTKMDNGPTIGSDILGIKSDDGLNTERSNENNNLKHISHEMEHNNSKTGLVRQQKENRDVKVATKVFDLVDKENFKKIKLDRGILKKKEQSKVALGNIVNVTTMPNQSSNCLEIKNNSKNIVLSQAETFNKLSNITGDKLVNESAKQNKLPDILENMAASVNVECTKSKVCVNNVPKCHEKKIALACSASKKHSKEKFELVHSVSSVIECPHCEKESNSSLQGKCVCICNELLVKESYTTIPNCCDNKETVDKYMKHCDILTSFNKNLDCCTYISEPHSPNCSLKQDNQCFKNKFNYECLTQEITCKQPTATASTTIDYDSTPYTSNIQTTAKNIDLCTINNLPSFRTPAKSSFLDKFQSEGPHNFLSSTPHNSYLVYDCANESLADMSMSSQLLDATIECNVAVIPSKKKKISSELDFDLWLKNESMVSEESFSKDSAHLDSTKLEEKELNVDISGQNEAETTQNYEIVDETNASFIIVDEIISSSQLELDSSSTTDPLRSEQVSCETITKLLSKDLKNSTQISIIDKEIKNIDTDIIIDYEFLTKNKTLNTNEKLKIVTSEHCSSSRESSEKIKLSDDSVQKGSLLNHLYVENSDLDPLKMRQNNTEFALNRHLNQNNTDKKSHVDEQSLASDSNNDTKYLKSSNSDQKRYSLLENTLEKNVLGSIKSESNGKEVCVKIPHSQITVSCSVTNNNKPPVCITIDEQAPRKLDVVHPDSNNLIQTVIAPEKKVPQPFKSEDPEENKDIEHPDWALIKNLETDEERYKQVRKCWQSRTIPNPNRDLTYHSFRKRRVMAEKPQVNIKNKANRGHKRSATHSPGKPQAKRQRTTTVPCTYFVDSEIQSVEQNYNKLTDSIRDEFRNNIRSLSRQHAEAEYDLALQTRENLYSPYSEYPYADTYSYALASTSHHMLGVQHNAEKEQLFLEHKHQMAEIDFERGTKLKPLEQTRNEINKFFHFYKGLNQVEKNEDPTVITESQMVEFSEMDNVHTQLYQYYYNPNT